MIIRTILTLVAVFVGLYASSYFGLGTIAETVVIVAFIFVFRGFKL